MTRARYVPRRCASGRACHGTLGRDAAILAGDDPPRCAPCRRFASDPEAFATRAAAAAASRATLWARDVDRLTHRPPR